MIGAVVCPEVFADSLSGNSLAQDPPLNFSLILSPYVSVSRQDLEDHSGLHATVASGLSPGGKASGALTFESWSVWLGMGAQPVSYSTNTTDTFRDAGGLHWHVKAGAFNQLANWFSLGGEVGIENRFFIRRPDQGVLAMSSLASPRFSLIGRFMLWQTDHFFAGGDLALGKASGGTVGDVTIQSGSLHRLGIFGGFPVFGTPILASLYYESRSQATSLSQGKSTELGLVVSFLMNPFGGGP
jgi:hypothetical protein